MRFAFAVFAANILALAFAGIGFYMIYRGIPGYGWLLFCALISVSSVKFKHTKS